MGDKGFIFRFDDVEVREREFTLMKAQVTQAVEPKAFRVLLILLKNPQKLIAKEDLLKAVWGDMAVTENSLARSIALLRRKLGDETRNPHYIGTVTKVGYRFLCRVEVLEDAEAPDMHAVRSPWGGLILRAGRLFRLAGQRTPRVVDHRPRSRSL